MTRSGAPWWRADRLAERLSLLKARGRAIAATRRFFDREGFLEVETPALQVSPGLEPHLVAFTTEIIDPGLGARTLYLHTSPEFAMKKLMAGGLERIFQLARVFRNAERSATHHPEFTMLEWYRAGEGYQSLIDDCIALVRVISEALSRPSLKWRGRTSDPWGDWQVLTVAEAFEIYAEVDLASTIDTPTRPSPEGLHDAALRLNLTPAVDDTWEDLFFRIFLERIEPHLGSPVPTVLMDYPISMAALARAKPDAPDLAERFELYVCGLELANAFGELTDPVAQRARFEADMSFKQERYGVRYPIDEDFLAALDPDRGGGLPESAGIALGFDRLVMLATGASHIEDVLWSPVAAPETR